MLALPPVGSLRRRLAIGFLAVFTALYALVLAYVLLLRHAEPLPIAAMIGGALCLLPIWRWVGLELRSSRHSGADHGAA